MPAQQPDREIEIKGPRVGAPENVLQSFLKAKGLSSLDACEQRDSGRGVFWFYVERVAGRPTAEVLAEILPAAIAGIPWPKSMRWAYDRQSWVRPLRNIAAVFDGALVPFEVELGSPAHAASHRLAQRDLRPSLPGAAELRRGGFQELQGPPPRAPGHARSGGAAPYDPQAGGEPLARAQALSLRPDEALLDEVVGLVEWPVVLLGRIDAAFMDLPPEVLTTVMRAHQKYFALEDSHGRLAPRFLVVSNMETRDHGATIVAGNERVLRARLADAQVLLGPGSQDLAGIPRCRR